MVLLPAVTRLLGTSTSRFCMVEMLRFLHLSDIHFHPSPGDPNQDVDVAVRDDLLEDIRGRGDRARPADAVLGGASETLEASHRADPGDGVGSGTPRSVFSYPTRDGRLGDGR